MSISVTNSWTLSFIREWWPYLSPDSVLRWRDCQIRDRRGSLREGETISLRLRSPIRSDVKLRELGNDSCTLHEVLVQQVYQSLLSRLTRVETIIDLGANIGLASLYLASRFPASRLVAVEPDAGNFALLSANLKRLAGQKRARALRAAVWSRDAAVVVNDLPSAHAYDSGSVREAGPADGGDDAVPGMSMERIIAEAGFDRVDVLKVDIEGAEVEMFHGDLSWLHRVGAIAIEFHGDSRAESGFDRHMRDYGFSVADSNHHTVLALQEPA